MLGRNNSSSRMDWHAPAESPFYTVNEYEYLIKFQRIVYCGPSRNRQSKIKWEIYSFRKVNIVHV